MSDLQATRPTSPDLERLLRTTVGRHLPLVFDSDELLDGVVEDLIPILRSVDTNADARGHRRALVELDENDDLPPWGVAVARARGGFGPAVRALAGQLVEEESTPPALRTISEAFLAGAPARVHERVRSADPETSVAAARAVAGRARPGGVVHKLLKAYDGNRRGHELTALGLLGLTAREAETRSSVRAAHKRTSELLREGLLDVQLDDAGRDVVRDGSRVLLITAAGRAELARLDDALQSRA